MTGGGAAGGGGAGAAPGATGGGGGGGGRRFLPGIATVCGISSTMRRYRSRFIRRDFRNWTSKGGSGEIASTIANAGPSTSSGKSSCTVIAMGGLRASGSASSPGASGFQTTESVNSSSPAIAIGSDRWIS